MLVIKTRNAHTALPEAVYQLKHHGVRRESRNGPVLVFPGPVTTVYERPWERVIFWPERDANPFFHLFESLWMLAGRNDVEFPASFTEKMRNYSDDGVTFHGAYGHRWRRHFGFDQLATIIIALRDNPDDRRCVLQMWDATADLSHPNPHKDIPCNTQAYFQRNQEGTLDITVCNRSNDIVWGCYGTNVVQFSMLQEFVASAIGCNVGRYWQISNNFHAYLDTFEQVLPLADRADDGFSPNGKSPYHLGVMNYPILNSALSTWLQDLDMLLSGGAIGIRDRFFRRIAAPMLAAHRAFKNTQDPNRFEKAFSSLDDCADSDWKLACQEWLQRRQVKFVHAKDAGVAYE